MKPIGESPEVDPDEIDAGELAAWEQALEQLRAEHDRASDRAQLHDGE